MLKFSQFLLLEGGGKVQTSKGEASTPIDLLKHGREKSVSDVHNFLSSVHDTVLRNTDQHLFGKDKEALHHRTMFSGSTEAFMRNKDVPGKKAIPDETFVHKWGKKSVGDVDTMVPSHHLEKGGSVEQALRPGSVHGNYSVEHQTRKGTQIHALVRHNRTGELHQVDFEPVRYEGNHPSPFAQEAYNSHPEDLEAGVKGLTHKGLLISATKGSSAFHGREYFKGKHAKVKHEGLVPDYTYSSQYGVRRKTERLGKDKDGSTVVREIKSVEKPEYDDNLPSVRKKIFGTPKAETQSFHGVVRSMKSHFTPTQVDHTLHFLKDEFKQEKYAPDQISKAIGIMKEQMPEHTKLLQKHFPEHF